MAKDSGDYSAYMGESEQERKLRLQEKNRKAQQAFRSRQKGKISELSDQCRVLEVKNNKQDARLRELQHDNTILQRALLHQTSEINRYNLEWTSVCRQHSEHLYIPQAQQKLDPSKDIVLKYPISGQSSKTEHLLIRHSELSDGSGIDKIADLFGQEWMPELVKLHEKLLELQDFQTGENPEDGGPPQPHPEVQNQVNEIAVHVKSIQRDVFECFMKAYRAQPVKSRILATDLLFNCHAALDHEEATKLAEEVVNKMGLSETEQRESCRHYEEYLCQMTLLQVQRTTVLDQLRENYACSEEVRLQKLGRETLQMKDFLSSSAAIEALQLFLHKENALYCDLLLVVATEVWDAMSFLKHMVHSSPGMADFLACMEVIRVKNQPGRTLKLLTLEFLNDHMNSNQDPSKADLLSSLSKGGMRGVDALRNGMQQGDESLQLSSEFRGHPPLSQMLNLGSLPSATPLDINSWDLDANKSGSLNTRMSPNRSLPSPRTLPHPHLTPSNNSMEQRSPQKQSSPHRASRGTARRASSNNSDGDRKPRNSLDDHEGSKHDSALDSSTSKHGKRKRTAVGVERGIKQPALESRDHLTSRQQQQQQQQQSLYSLHSWHSNDRNDMHSSDNYWRNSALNHLSQAGMLSDELSKPNMTGWGNSHDHRARLSLSQMLRGDSIPGQISGDLAHHLMSMPMPDHFPDRSLMPDMLNSQNLSSIGLDLVRNNASGRSRIDSLSQLIAVAEESQLHQMGNRNSLNGGINQILGNLGTAAALQQLIPNSGPRQDTLTCLSDMLVLDAANLSGRSAGNKPGGPRAFLAGNPQQGMSNSNWSQRKTPAQLHQEYTTFLGEDDLQRPGLIQRM